MNTKGCIFFVLHLLSLTLMAQKDTSKNLQEVVVTATRTTKSIGSLPIPVTLITKSQIQQSGLQKLSDVLQQSGLQIATNILGQSLQGYPNPFGTGIQLQGLDAGYTLILMDGVPMTGRNAGVLNLDRIAINNIKQVEIIKGPAASLYGADALAGVINIITDDAQTRKSQVQLNYASHHTFNAAISTSFNYKKSNTHLFFSTTSSQGYDLDKAIYGKTIDAGKNYSLSAKTSIKLSNKTTFKNINRFFVQKQFNDYLVYTATQPQVVKGTPIETDWGVQNELKHIIDTKTNITARLYVTGYNNNASVYLQSTNMLFDKSFLKQLLLKNEYILEHTKKQGHTFLSGIGAEYETISSSRYASKKELNTAYGFAQKEFTFFNKLNITAGVRADKHRFYKFQLNPRVATALKVSKDFTVLVSYGNGFKTPDFRQQFLFFTNALVGYTLLGANELANGLVLLKQQGQIDNSININPFLNNQQLTPEKSTGINAELKWRVLDKIKLTAGFFRNDIKNLIERYTLPFTKTNGQSIYSYKNISNVFTQGYTLHINAQLFSFLNISTTYQYLDAKDKEVIKQIKKGQVVKRDPFTYNSSYTAMKEYGGLFNRSKHTATLQTNFNNQKKQINVSARITYIGRAGYSDINGNSILDDNREYAKSYTLLGATFSKEFNKFQIQCGANNLLNYKDAIKHSELSGITAFTNINFYLNKIFTTKQ